MPATGPTSLTSARDTAQIPSRDNVNRTAPMGMRMRRALAVSSIALAGLLFAAPAALAADDYTADPNGLINHYDDVSRYSTGTDRWRVWVCDTAFDGTVGIVADAVDILNGEIADVYDWLSDGIYDIQFEAGGTVSVPTEDGDDCIQAVLDASTPSGANGVRTRGLRIVGASGRRPRPIVLPRDGPLAP